MFADGWRKSIAAPTAGTWSLTGFLGKGSGLARSSDLKTRDFVLSGQVPFEGFDFPADEASLRCSLSLPDRRAGHANGQRNHGDDET